MLPRRPLAPAALGAATLLPLLGCASDGPGVSVAFASSSLNLPEDGSAATVTLELTVKKATLASDVQVDVRDTGTGSATSGSDYAAFATTTVVFAAGASSGDTATVGLTSTEDELFEGNETVVLQLANAQGVALGKPRTATVTIVDDEVPARLVATLDDGGGAEDFANGDAFDFGVRALGGAAEPVTLRLRNGGDTPLSLSAPEFVAGDPREFSAEADPALQVSAKLAPAGQHGASSFSVLASDPLGGLDVAVSPAVVEDLAGRSAARLEGVPVPGLGTVALDLERVPSPWLPGAELTLDGVPVAGGPEALLGGLSLWQGTVDGWPSSRVYLGLSEHGTRGWIRFAPDEVRTLHVLAGAEPYALRLAWTEQLEAHGVPGRTRACGGVRTVDGAPALSAPGPGSTGVGPALDHDPAPPKVLTPTVARVLFETDHQFFQVFGDESAAATYVAQTVGAVSDLYVEHAQTRIAIASLALYPSPDDPWAAPDGPASADALLDEFADERGPLPNDVDLGHFISAANFPDAAGLAFLDTLCNPNFGFSITAFADGTFDAAGFDGSPAVSHFDFNTIAHELGHNFGALHTDQYCPPIDSCQPTCEGGAACSLGTIMSNCNICPGGEASIDPRFHPFIANEIRQRVNSGCLGDSTLAPDESLVLELNFAPFLTDDAGAKSARLAIEHDGDNTASPFEIRLQGFSTN